MAENCRKIENQLHGIEKQKRRSRSVLRPNAALKEKERLKAFNEALKNLQEVIPIKLPEGRKLHKKQTIQVGGGGINDRPNLNSCTAAWHYLK